MSPVAVVALIGVVTFLFGAAAPVVFGPPEEERERATAIDWLVRGLVGAAVAHTALGVLAAIDQARQTDDLTRVLLSQTAMSLLAFGGILLGLAALLHLLSRRFETRPDAR